MILFLPIAVYLYRTYNEIQLYTHRKFVANQHVQFWSVQTIP
jgi:hypothetical protein